MKSVTTPVSNPANRPNFQQIGKSQEVNPGPGPVCSHTAVSTTERPELVSSGAGLASTVAAETAR